MKSIYNDEQQTPETPVLALRLEDAAAALGCSAKHLWNHSFPRGPIPVVRIGSLTRWPVHLLREYMTAEAERQRAEHNRATEGAGNE